MNKPRLIDAHKTLKDLAACKCFPKMSYSLKDFQDLILAQPIAYDIDKVVEHLEHLRSVTMDDYIVYTKKGLYEEAISKMGKYVGIKRAIEIVKGGMNNE